MKYLNKFNEKKTDEVYKKINHICKIYDIKNYTINPDESIDVNNVNEGVNLYNKGLKKLPLKFNKINGDFDCDDNKLTSLEGSP